ncbi:hypothetical protein MMON44395_19895 [Mycolicibacterium monacense DSM 44395]|nr:hypothetical protein [Mycolicibacterium monacense DSM 44395]
MQPRRPRWRPVTLFVLLSAGYFVVGAVLILRYNIFEGDGISRVANAGFTLMSRDPHLSAIGFVWNPLPSLVQIPILPLSRWFPELKTHGLTGVFQSAVFMAGSALLVRQIAIDRDAGRVWRWAAVGCFALNPVIVIYGGIGMSEAAEIFCVLWCVRHLLLWVEAQRVGDLAWAGMALGVGYLVRYEMVPAACGAAVLVAVVVFIRSPPQARTHSAVLSVTIVVFPIATAVLAWAVTGWIVNGELFATMSSQYGNTSQVAVARARGGLAHDADWWVIAQRLFAMQPFVGIAVILAVARCALTKAADALVPVATFGAVLAFASWGQYSGTTFGWFRFYILAIPLVIVVALVCWKPTARPVDKWRLDTLPSKLGATLLCASLFLGIPVTTRSILNDDSNQVMLGINSLIDPLRYPPDEQWYRRIGNDSRLMADYLDRKHLPEGSVLMDTFMTWGVWLASDNPKQFVITSDYDFTAALNRPWDHGVQYILVTNPPFTAAPDAINKRYPTMWADGAGIGTLVHSAAGAFGEEEWRVYRVVKPPEYKPPPPKPTPSAQPPQPAR